MKNSKKVIALEARLRRCKNVITLGVKPNLADYNPKDQEKIREAKKIYYPSTFYADLFDAMGKKTFPTYHTYKCVQDKIKQTALFNLLKIPHPKTRVFYGKAQKNKIKNYFSMPFIAKIPQGSAMGRGVYLIKNEEELKDYLSLLHVAYIQKYLAIDRDIRVVIIGGRCVHSYWRIAKEGEFRTNVALGGTISIDGVPKEAKDLALYTARKCQWDDVGMDICMSGGHYYVLEANMKYGKEGFRAAGIDYIQLVEDMIANGQI